MDFTSIRFIMHAIMPMSFSTLKSIMPPSSCSKNIHNSDSISYTPFLADKPKTTARLCLLYNFALLSTTKYIIISWHCQGQYSTRIVSSVFQRRVKSHFSKHALLVIRKFVNKKLNVSPNHV